MSLDVPGVLKRAPSEGALDVDVVEGGGWKMPSVSHTRTGPNQGGEGAAAAAAALSRSLDEFFSGGPGGMWEKKDGWS